MSTVAGMKASNILKSSMKLLSPRSGPVPVSGNFTTGVVEVSGVSSTPGVGVLDGTPGVTGVFVGTSVGVPVQVGVGLGLSVPVGVFVGVPVLVGVSVGVSVGTSVEVLVAVGVSVGVLVGLTVGTFVGTSVGFSPQGPIGPDRKS